VATDLETGDSVVMTAGDLTSAMRASMSAPGIFAPVERQGRVLVDGGIANNLPVDVARAMGVDVLIVVDVGSPLLPRQKLSDVPAISNQMLAILIRRNVEQQLATLGPHDILIQPPLGDASSFDFGHVGRFIRIGEAAARADSARFASLAVSEEQMQHYLADRQTARLPPPVISFVRSESGSEEYSAALDKAFRDLTGRALDPDRLAQRVTALYGQGGLDTLDYQVVSEDDRYGLALDARPSAMGPDYLRFGLTLQDDFKGNSTYTAAVRFVMSDVTRTGGQWATDVQIGSVGGVYTELWVPLAKFSGWFVDPHIGTQTYNIDLLQGQAQLAEYRAHTFAYGLDFGYQFGNWGEIRTGVQRREEHYSLTIGDPDDPNLPQLVPGYPESFQPFSLRDYFVRFSYDRLDDVNFPHSGQHAQLQLSAYRNVDGATAPANQATLNYTAAHSYGRDTLVLSASGGTTFDQQGSFTNAGLLFPLGGFLNLSGLRYNSLLGPNYGIARVIYYHQIGRGGPGFFEVPTYLGGSLEAGNVWQTPTPGSFRKDASVFLGLDTLLGPVYVASGFDEHGNQSYYLLLGRTF